MAKKTPLVLIHGFPFNHTMWQTQIDVLASTYQVIAPDLRGFGETPLDEPEGEFETDQGISMEAYAVDLLAVLDQLQIDEPVILCGFSMGGYILWQFARQFPERVKALVLADTRTAADTAEASAGRLKMADGVLQNGTDAIPAAMLPKLLSVNTLANRLELVEQVTKMLLQESPAAIAAAQRGMARRPDVQSELANFDWPALVLVGAEDVISPPAEMRELAASLPQAEFCELANAGHMSPLENPAAFNQALLKFMNRL